MCRVEALGRSGGEVMAISSLLVLGADEFPNSTGYYNHSGRPYGESRAERVALAEDIKAMVSRDNAVDPSGLEFNYKDTVRTWYRNGEKVDIDLEFRMVAVNKCHGTEFLIASTRVRVQGSVANNAFIPDKPAR